MGTSGPCHTKEIIVKNPQLTEILFRRIFIHQHDWRARSRTWDLRVTSQSLQLFGRTIVIKKLMCFLLTVQIFSLGTWRKKNIQGSTAELELEEDEMFDQTMDSSKEKSSSLKRTFLIKSQSSRKKLEEVFQVSCF